MTAIEEIDILHQDKIKFKNMPKEFFAILFIEFWERFAFYGLQSVAVLLFIKEFSLTESDSGNLFSSFSALLYALLVIGGYIGDRVLGLKRTYFLGIIFLMIGYGAFGIVNTTNTLYFALGLILVGNILFKTNAGNFVNRCFKPNDPRLDSAFTYFYMSINAGSFISIVLIPIISAKTSFQFGIACCGVGMAIALVSFFILSKSFGKIDNAVGKARAKSTSILLAIFVIGVVLAYLLGQLLQDLWLSKIFLFSCALIVCVIYFIVKARVNTFEQKAMTIAFILLVQSIVFWIVYMQMSTSLTLFAIHNVRTTFLGYVIPPEITQSFNSFFIIILSPVLAIIYNKFELAKTPISIPRKFSLGVLLNGVAYLTIAFGCFFPDNNGTISIIWLFIGYGLYSIGELLVSAIGLSMVSKLIPGRMGGFAQAMWFLFSAIGQRLGGIIAGYGGVNSNLTTNIEILNNYQVLFTALGTGVLIFSIIMIAYSKKLTTNMNLSLQALNQA
jgi:POT family proton-dependent oligopeptide transporter